MEPEQHAGAPRRVLTRNRMGWASQELSPLSVKFVEWAAAGQLTVLDIGAAYGAASLAALAAGATVIANDLEPEHLEELAKRVPAADRGRLILKPGRFPRGVHCEDGSLGAVHASSVFHFLTGRQMEEGMRAIGRWLGEGGRLFVQAATPYQAPFASFLDEYRRRVERGENWPGWVEKVSEYCTHRQRGQMPRSIHLLDDAVLRRAAEAAGLVVEEAWLYQRPDLPVTLRLDGRETVGLVARKRP